LVLPNIQTTTTSGFSWPSISSHKGGRGLPQGLGHIHSLTTTTKKAAQFKQQASIDLIIKTSRAAKNKPKIKANKHHWKQLVRTLVSA